MLAPQVPSDAPRLFIVDDEEPLRIAVMRWFTRRGWLCHDTGTMAGAEDALFAEGTTPPDVIICDLNLPDGSGEALLGRIERDRPEWVCRVIVSTGEVLTDAMQARLDAAGCRVLPKPFELSQAEALSREAREARHAREARESRDTKDTRQGRRGVAART